MLIRSRPFFRRLGELASGLFVWNVTDYAFDCALYPFVVWKLGPVVGGGMKCPCVPSGSPAVGKAKISAHTGVRPPGMERDEIFLAPSNIRAPGGYGSSNIPCERA